jgi:hypothetical protein
MNKMKFYYTVEHLIESRLDYYEEIIGEKAIFVYKIENNIPKCILEFITHIEANSEQESTFKLIDLGYDEFELNRL